MGRSEDSMEKVKQKMAAGNWTAVSKRNAYRLAEQETVEVQVKSGIYSSNWRPLSDVTLLPKTWLHFRAKNISKVIEKIY